MWDEKTVSKNQYVNEDQDRTLATDGNLYYMNLK